MFTVATPYAPGKIPDEPRGGSTWRNSVQTSVLEAEHDRVGAHLCEQAVPWDYAIERFGELPLRIIDILINVLQHERS